MSDNVCGTAPKAKASSSKRSHPLDPLDPDEVTYAAEGTETTITDLSQITATSRVVQLYAAEILSIKTLRFIVCSLLPPPKKQVLAYLGIPLATGQEPDAHPGELPRKAEVDVSPISKCSKDPRLTFCDSSLTC
jgi:primary-amine oxidase